MLESDALRHVLTPNPTYGEAERDLFYHQMVYIGFLLVSHGVPVIFDATANRRRYRDEARRQIPQFVEVFVECPLETCMARDPKKIYRQVGEGAASSVPGAQVDYEPPLHPEATVRSEYEDTRSAARRIAALLAERGLIEQEQT